MATSSISSTCMSAAGTGRHSMPPTAPSVSALCCLCWTNCGASRNSNLPLQESFMDLTGKKIVLGLTGGIACYKAAELTRGLTKAGAFVQVVMTEGATHFITAVTMQALSGNTVYTDQWDARIDNNMPHIDLTRDADAILIAPCSADFMSKLAH